MLDPEQCPIQVIIPREAVWLDVTTAFDIVTDLLGKQSGEQPLYSLAYTFRLSHLNTRTSDLERQSSLQSQTWTLPCAMSFHLYDLHRDSTYSARLPCTRYS